MAQALFFLIYFFNMLSGSLVFLHQVATDQLDLFLDIWFECNFLSQCLIDEDVADHTFR